MSIAANHILTSREPGRSIRFLVADCDTKVCRRLWNIIRASSETWCVQTTRSGREALQFIRTSHVDIAILNIDLPDLNGLEIQRTVWQEFLRTDVIILIDTDSTETAVGAMKAGARDVLVKPVNEDELFASIHESLDRLHTSRGCFATGLVHPFEIACGITGSKGPSACSDPRAIACTSLRHDTASRIKVDYPKPFAKRRE